MAVLASQLWPNSGYLSLQASKFERPPQFLSKFQSPKFKFSDLIIPIVQPKNRLHIVSTGSITALLPT